MESLLFTMPAGEYIPPVVVLMMSQCYTCMYMYMYVRQMCCDIHGQVQGGMCMYAYILFIMNYTIVCMQ